MRTHRDTAPGIRQSELSTWLTLACELLDATARVKHPSNTTYVLSSFIRTMYDLLPRPSSIPHQATRYHQSTITAYLLASCLRTTGNHQYVCHDGKLPRWSRNSHTDRPRIRRILCEANLASTQVALIAARHATRTKSPTQGHPPTPNKSSASPTIGIESWS